MAAQLGLAPGVPLPANALQQLQRLSAHGLAVGGAAPQVRPSKSALLLHNQRPACWRRLLHGWHCIIWAVSLICITLEAPETHHPVALLPQALGLQLGMGQQQAPPVSYAAAAEEQAPQQAALAAQMQEFAAMRQGMLAPADGVSAAEPPQQQQPQAPAEQQPQQQQPHQVGHGNILGCSCAMPGSSSTASKALCHSAHFELHQARCCSLAVRFPPLHPAHCKLRRLRCCRLAVPFSWATTTT